ncbi:MAG TPA: carbamoyl-phosphate synthase large subunit [Deltaproteobacteria bacterium]|nr:carbamoyl-phosphate synthase large subunit [Deltaproteobacteria bacterium]
MPKRTDINKILLIGSGPIIIGQACEFDYSGTQACKALRAEGYEVVLVNSNPASIMTDPNVADRTYVEPITVETVEKIIERERPDALLPTMGGQTALNTAVGLASSGVLERFGVEMIGADLDAIMKAEERHLFKEAMERIGLMVPGSGVARSADEAMELARRLRFPLILRPSFTLGGTGGGVAYNAEEFDRMIRAGLDASPTGEVLIEESVIGWKEFELEVMRDHKDNVVIVCSIENFDPMGVHTGDSITVAPAQTLSDKEYQELRDAAVKIIREIGVDTGGSNIQFAVNPRDGRVCVIEMNPRVSRSSALASKATGFPIAKIAAKLAVGLTLDEIANDITRRTPACFEPTIDYVVVKFPRFAFEKFPDADSTLTTQMKSVGEAMSIGRTFKEAMHKALRSLETGSSGFERRIRPGRPQVELRCTDEEREALKAALKVPGAERVWYICEALRAGLPAEEIHGLTMIDPWFIDNLRGIVELEREIAAGASGGGPDPELMRRAKQAGFSFRTLETLTGRREDELRSEAVEAGIVPVYKTVDTCAAEFEAFTPYLYSTYETPFHNIYGAATAPACEASPTERKKVLILGSGPNRIGQGIEFDYCCVHASFALREEGIESVMVNCNPETVSTDYDTSDRLYFEPLTFEDVMAIVEKERPMGVIVQLGGQTPLKLAVPLERSGVKILGTSPDSIDMAEDRERFSALIGRLGLRTPASGTARSIDEAVAVAGAIGYPVMVRPSYVLGGRAMEIVYSEKSLVDYMGRAVEASPEHPVLIDRFLDNAVEVDVDCVSDGRRVVIGGLMEHIEEAGIHSGDSACSLPPYSLPEEVLDEVRRQTVALALELKVVGLMNVQFAVKDGEVYILEVNPRGSRTIPFVSKAIGRPLAKIATKLMVGRTLEELGFTEEVRPPYTSVKEAVFPFVKFPGVDSLLGPEMKSTGEVMGLGSDFGGAFAKSQVAAGNRLPLEGTVFISVRDEDKEAILPIARRFREMGFDIMATSGTHRYLSERGVASEFVHKVTDGRRPHIVDRIKSREVALMINTTFGDRSVRDSYSLRRSALDHGVPYYTTVAGAKAAILGVRAMLEDSLEVRPLQEYHGKL